MGLQRALSLALAIVFTLMSSMPSTQGSGIGAVTNHTAENGRDVKESCMARVLQLLSGRPLSVANTELILKRLPPPIDQLNAATADTVILSAVLGGENLATQLVQCLTGQREECRRQHPCNHAGKCVYATSGAQRGSYQCQCDMGHAGNFCQTALPLCAANPCKNGATCKQRGSSFHCHCPPLHSGRHCEKQWFKERTFNRHSSALFKVIKDVQKLKADAKTARKGDADRTEEFLARLKMDVLSMVSASLGNLTSRVAELESMNRQTTPTTATQTEAPTGEHTLCTRGDLGPSGVFSATTLSGRYTAYCDRETDGGGWTVFQRRKDGSVDFYRDWNPYKHGFGSASGEFWLGLETVHQLTSQAGRSYELRIDMVYRSNGQKDYVKYSSFKVDSEDTNYTLHVSGFSSSGASRGDGLSYHNGHAFSTRDRDNDKKSGQCSVQFKGAWWYNACYHSSLNGVYGNSGTTSPNFDSGSRELRFVEMKFRQTL
eukprot:scpid59793/ scgid17836/ Tenascin-X; Hexabrachion-like protein